MQSNKTQTYGITLPIALGEQGYFAQSYNVLEQVRSNLVLLLQTKKGERRMNPEFGSGLWNVLFENINDDLAPIIESTIRKDISRWMGYVNVTGVTVSNNRDESHNRMDVSISFTVPSIGMTVPQNVTLQMNTNNI